MFLKKYMYCIICLVSGCLCINAFSQDYAGVRNKIPGKPPIDTSTINNWYGVDEDYHVAISNDGKWFTYRVKNLPRDANTLYVESTNKNWSRSFVNAEKVVFSDDNRSFVFKRNDSLFLQKLGSESDAKIISKVKVFKTVSSDKYHWLAYQLQGSNELLLLDLINGERRIYSSGDNFIFNDQGTILLLQENNTNASKFSWINLQANSSATIYSGDKVVSSQFDKSGTKLVFSVLHIDKSYSVLQYNVGMKSAAERVNSRVAKLETGMDLGPAVEFSNDGRYLYLELKKRLFKPVSNEDAALVNIWSSSDSIIHSAQSVTLQEEFAYPAVISAEPTSGSRIVKLVNSDESLNAKPNYGDYVVVTWNNLKEIGDRSWLPVKYKSWLVSLENGSRMDFGLNVHSLYFFSPGGKYIILWNSDKGNYLSYDIQTKRMVNLCEGKLKNQFVHSSDFYPTSEFKGAVGLAGWLSDDGLLVYDNYDVWNLDVNGKNKPRNLTNAIQSDYKIKFRLVNQDLRFPVFKNGKLLLTAYDPKTKENGFIEIQVNAKERPKLTLEPYTYYHHRSVIEGEHDFYSNMQPLKAKHVGVWIVKRQTFNESPNYFITKDFKQYLRLTSFDPQKDRNWLTAELVNYKQTDSISSQFIMYRPENFDSTKMYPVLINYYSQYTHRLFEFPKPEITKSAHIDISWFTSRGYIVITPDIYFHKKPQSQSALHSVTGVAEHLKKFMFIDTNRIGIAGHSKAGGLTNYIVTRTNLFSAALCGAPGGSDMISRALQLVEEGNQLATFEGNVGGKIWDIPDRWVKSSAIMGINHVTTPYLIFHCRKDGVPFQQTVEMFIALRRLNKKVWWLEYDNGFHSLYDSCDAFDFTTRVTQFFDHYLKGAPAPKWMTEGIPAKMKGIKDGLELDTENKVP